MESHRGKYRKSNPMLDESRFKNAYKESHVSRSMLMTLEGTYKKALLSLLISLFCAATVWNQYAQALFEAPIGTPLPQTLRVLFYTSFASCMFMSFAAYFRPHWAYFITPIYAALKGISLSILSLLLEKRFKIQGTSYQALLATVAVVLSLTLVHNQKWFVMTHQRVKMVYLSLIAVVVLSFAYTLLFSLGFTTFTIPLSSPLSIATSIGMVALSSFCLLADFFLIEELCKARVTKEMEWYCALSVLTSILFIYLEVLRLLVKLKASSRRR